MEHPFSPPPLHHQTRLAGQLAFPPPSPPPPPLPGRRAHEPGLALPAASRLLAHRPSLPPVAAALPSVGGGCQWWPLWRPPRLWGTGGGGGASRRPRRRARGAGAAPAVGRNAGQRGGVGIGAGKEGKGRRSSKGVVVAAGYPVVTWWPLSVTVTPARRRAPARVRLGRGDCPRGTDGICAWTTFPPLHCNRTVVCALE